MSKNPNPFAKGKPPGPSRMIVSDSPNIDPHEPPPEDNGKHPEPREDEDEHEHEGEHMADGVPGAEHEHEGDVSVEVPEGTQPEAVPVPEDVDEEDLPEQTRREMAAGRRDVARAETRNESEFAAGRAAAEAAAKRQAKVRNED